MRVSVYTLCAQAYTMHLGGGTRLVQLLAYSKCAPLLARLLALCTADTTTKLMVDITCNMWQVARRDVVTEYKVRTRTHGPISNVCSCTGAYSRRCSRLCHAVTPINCC
jgi:hypothetical protein